MTTGLKAVDPKTQSCQGLQRPPGLSLSHSKSSCPSHPPPRRSLVRRELDGTSRPYECGAAGTSGSSSVTAPGSVTPSGALPHISIPFVQNSSYAEWRRSLPHSFTFLLAPRCSVFVCISVCIWGKGQSAKNPLRFLIVITFLRTKKKGTRVRCTCRFCSYHSVLFDKEAYLGGAYLGKCPLFLPGSD